MNVTLLLGEGKAEAEGAVIADRVMDATVPRATVIAIAAPVTATEHAVRPTQRASRIILCIAAV